MRTACQTVFRPHEHEHLFQFFGWRLELGGSAGIFSLRGYAGALVIVISLDAYWSTCTFVRLPFEPGPDDKQAPISTTKAAIATIFAYRGFPQPKPSLSPIRFFWPATIVQPRPV